MAGDFTNWFANLFQGTQVPPVQAAGDVIHPYTLAGNLVPANSMVPSGPILHDPPSVQAAIASQTAPFLSPQSTGDLNLLTPWLAMQLKGALTFPRPEPVPIPSMTRIPSQRVQPTAINQMQILQELMKRYGRG